MNYSEEELIREAFQAQKRAYAPYSGFEVGAALRLAAVDVAYDRLSAVTAVRGSRY